VNARYKNLTEFPGPLVNPEFTWYPLQKTLYFKDKRRNVDSVPRPPVPDEIAPLDMESHRLQETVQIDVRFDWAAAIVEAKAEEEAKLKQIQKNRDMRNKVGHFHGTFQQGQRMSGRDFEFS